MRSRVFLRTALLLVGLSLPSVAQADPIVITGGTIVQPGGIADPGSGSLVGTQNFTWIGQIDGFANFGNQCEIRCSPGVTVNLGGMIGASNVKGDVTYQDQQFRVGGIPDSFGVLNFNFVADSFVLPPAESSAVFSSPFTATGFLRLPFFGPPAQPDVPLSGSGMVTASFLPSQSGLSGGPGWRLGELRYEFAAADPVPEPSTMLLVGGGMAALLRRRLRSRRVS